MEVTGSIKAINTDFITNDLSITLNINEKQTLINEYEKLKGFEKLSIKIVKYKKKRSLDSNSYMWILLQKMACILHTTKDDLYLEILGRYGVFTHIIVKPNVVDRVKSEWKTVRDLGEVTVNGIIGVQLQCYFGSSTYDTKEMGHLIDGVVSECKELEIEVLTPIELERMKSQWGANEKKN